MGVDCDIGMRRLQIRMASEEKRGGREISLYAGRPLRRSEAGRKNRPAPFEMTVWGWGTVWEGRCGRKSRPAPFEMTVWGWGTVRQGSSGRKSRLAPFGPVKPSGMQRTQMMGGDAGRESGIS